MRFRVIVIEIQDSLGQDLRSRVYGFGRTQNGAVHHGQRGPPCELCELHAAHPLWGLDRGGKS